MENKYSSNSSRQLLEGTNGRKRISSESLKQWKSAKVRKTFDGQLIHGSVMKERDLNRLPKAVVQTPSLRVPKKLHHLSWDMSSSDGSSETLLSLATGSRHTAAEVCDLYSDPLSSDSEEALYMPVGILLSGVAKNPITSAGPFFDLPEFNPYCPTDAGLLQQILDYDMDWLDQERPYRTWKQTCKDWLHRATHFGALPLEEYLFRYPWEAFYEPELYRLVVHDEYDEYGLNRSMLPDNGLQIGYDSLLRKDKMPFSYVPSSL